jgi:hypothetical protein
MADPTGEFEKALDDVEKALDETARMCLRLINTASLTLKQCRALSKWMYGCQNQRFNLRRRVEKHGSDELRKVKLFIARACEALLEIDSS